MQSHILSGRHFLLLPHHPFLSAQEQKAHYTSTSRSSSTYPNDGDLIVTSLLVHPRSDPESRLLILQPPITSLLSYPLPTDRAGLISLHLHLDCITWRDLVPFLANKLSSKYTIIDTKHWTPQRGSYRSLPLVITLPAIPNHLDCLPVRPIATRPSSTYRPKPVLWASTQAAASSRILSALPASSHHGFGHGIYREC